jgi:hypothetical protein
MTLDSFHINAAFPFIRELYKIMPLYARNDVTLCKEYHTLGKILPHKACTRGFCFENNLERPC